MKTPLAWKNLSHARRRTATALGGVAFAILLIFMQLGFYASARDGAVLIYEAMDFDLLVVSPEYVNNTRPGDFHRSRIEQARSLKGVTDVIPLWLAVGDWRNPVTGEAWDMLLVGVRPGDRPFRSSALNAQLPPLATAGTALFDRRSRPEYGHPPLAGTAAEINGRRVDITGEFAVGTGYVAAGATIMSRQTLARINAGGDEDRVNVGLVKLQPGARARDVRAALAALGANDTLVLTRPELLAREQHYWLRTKPVGIMFTCGVIVALLVGAVILYQILVSEVQHHRKEYATLKALGYNAVRVRGVIFQQGLMLALLGYVPALLAGALLYRVMWSWVYLPVTMEWSRALGVLLLTLLMSLAASALAARTLGRTDPAELL